MHTSRGLAQMLGQYLLLDHCFVSTVESLPRSSIAFVSQARCREGLISFAFAFQYFQYRSLIKASCDKSFAFSSQDLPMQRDQHLEFSNEVLPIQRFSFPSTEHPRGMMFLGIVAREDPRMHVLRLGGESFEQ